MIVDPPPAAMIQTHGLGLAYGRRTAVSDVDLAIAPGTCVALVGPNGSGKSTLLRGLARQMRPVAGAVVIDGRKLAQWPPRALARMLAVLPQSPQSPGELTVEQLVALGRHPHQAFLGMTNTADREAVRTALAQTDMTAFATRPISALSGGERQRAWIALTLAQDPRILLLDEPTTYLDLGHGLAILELVQRLNHERGLTVVMSLHDLSQAARYAGRVVVMQGGRIAAQGTPAEVLTPATIRRVFGVEVEILQTAGGLPVIAPLRVQTPATGGQPGDRAPSALGPAPAPVRGLAPPP